MMKFGTRIFSSAAMTLLPYMTYSFGGLITPQFQGSMWRDLEHFGIIVTKYGKCGEREVNMSDDTNPINDYDDDFWTPLMHAVEDGDMKRFEELLAEGAHVNMGNVEGETYPITLAAEYGRDEMFFRLVELGANMDVDEYCCPCCNMWYGFSPADLFVYAMESGSMRIARYLCSKGVRPWSHTRSMCSGGATVREVAKAHKKEDFLKSVFTEKELVQQTQSVDSSE